MQNSEKKHPLYTLSGRIVHGRGIGKKAGMPTANLEITKDMVIPKLGVYASEVKLGGSKYTGVTNVGLRPTVDSDKDITIETYILNFDGDIYEETIELELFVLLRRQQKFEDMTMLLEQLRKDCDKAKKYFGV
ncbi:MAG: hypothetical protein E7261_12050 [Lachnospiraceae bacterium]|nr:hypothetical protein [Lachnospiraceae bacterium]